MSISQHIPNNVGNDVANVTIYTYNVRNEQCQFYSVFHTVYDCVAMYLIQC